MSVRLGITHEAGSTADAYALVIEDTLPPGLIWVSDAGVGGSCPSLTVDSSAAPLIRFQFDELRLADASCDITYDVEVDPNVQPGQQLQNTALLTYDSTPAFVAGQTRQDISSAVADVIVFAPTLIKVAVDSSQPGTSLDQGDPTLLDLTIGETVTYELTLVLPEALVSNVVLVDTLPAGAGGFLEAVGASVVAVGSQISTTLPGTPVLSDDQLGDGIDDTVTLDFGDITNLPDGEENEGDQIVIQVVARVIDLPENVGGVVLTNRAVVTSDTDTLEDTADVEVVEPTTELTKTMSLLADGVVRISLLVENTGTAPAYDLEINDVLSDADWDVANLTPVSIPAGFELVTLADTPAPGEQTVRFATDPGAVEPAGTVPAGSTVAVTFDAPLAVLPPQPNPLPNEATQDAADTLPGPDGNARDLPTDSAIDEVALPELVLRKTATLRDDVDGSGDVSPGDLLRYTLVMNNIGVADATAVLIQDAPDPNSALVVGSVSTSLGTVAAGNTPGDTTVEILLATLGAGSEAIVTYDTTLPNPLPAGVETVVNQATFDSEELPPGLSDDPSDPTGDQDPTVVPINAQPDLVLGKDDGNVTTQPGSTIAWTLTYENVGNQAATGVILSDTVPANTTFLGGASSFGWICTPDAQAGSTCGLSLGEVPAGASGSVTFSVVVDAVVPAGVTEIANIARIVDDGTNGPDPTPDDNTASDTTPLDAVPDLVVTKDDGGATAIPGQPLAWALQVLNVGNQEATGVVLSDTVPANTTFDAAASTAGWSCVPDALPGSLCSLSLGSLAVTEDVTVAFVVRVDNPLPAGLREIVNTATVRDDGANGADPTPDNNQATDQTPVASEIDVAITKTDGAVVAEPAQTVVYTLSYDNRGTQGVTGVVIEETVPANTRFNAGASTSGWTCPPDAGPGVLCSFTVGGLASGAGGTVLFGVTLEETLPETVTEIVNTVTIRDDGSNGPDGNPGNNVASETTPANVTVRLDLTKALSDAPDPIVVGSVLEYTLVASNMGNVVLTNVVVSDSLVTPTGGTTPCARLLPTETCSLVGTYTVTQADVNRGRVDNTGTATSDQTGPREADVSVPLGQTFGLTLDKSASLQDSNGNGLGDQGERVSYQLIATNEGNTTLSDVLISDPLLPSLICQPAQPASLAPAAVLTCSGSYTLASNDLLRPELVNRAEVTGNAPDGTTLTDDATASIPVKLRIIRNVPVMGLPAILLTILAMAAVAAPAMRRRRSRR